MDSESKRAAGKMEIQLRCRINATMLRLLREVITSIATHFGFSEEQCSEIEMCVDEACANALEHAYGDEQSEAEKLVCIETLYDGQALTVRVSDTGSGLQKAMKIPIQDLELYTQPGREQYRGLGFYLMHKFMDHVNVRTAPGEGTTVEMTKIRK